PATVRLRTGGGVIVVHVRVSDTDAERQHGLAGVRHLPADSGMAFVFDRPGHPAVWMRDTPISLSIAFWSTGGRIVEIRNMLPCHRDPCPTYRPPAPIVGAIEVNRGFFRQHRVKIGDRVDLRRN